MAGHGEGWAWGPPRPSGPPCSSPASLQKRKSAHPTPGLNPSTASCRPEPLKSQPSGPPTSLSGLSPPSLHWSQASFPGPLQLTPAPGPLHLSPLCLEGSARTLPWLLLLSQFSPLWRGLPIFHHPHHHSNPFIFFKTAVTTGGFSRCLFSAPFPQPKQKLMGTDVLWLICRCVLHLE